MALFPNILDRSFYNSNVQSIQHQPPHPQPPQSFLHRHLPTDVFISILSHLFSPSMYLHHASSHQQPHSHPYMAAAAASTTRAPLAKPTFRLVVDDDYMLMEDEEELDGEEDGAPLCREAEIEKWKLAGCVQERRRMLH